MDHYFFSKKKKITNMQMKKCTATYLKHQEKQFEDSSPVST